MPETPPIPPALSENEWANRNTHAGLPNAETPGEAAYIVHADGIVSQVGHLEVLHNGRVSVGTRHTHAAMALVNAALPDDHPGKITRAMVDDLRIAQHEARKAVAADCMNGPCDECKAACERFCARLEAHALALAALLPPTEGGVGAE